MVCVPSYFKASHILWWQRVFVMRAYLPGKGIVLGNDISLATSMGARMKGLLGKKSLDSGKGLLIRPCKGIHTFFMKFSIDAVFLDKEDRIVEVFRDLPPNRLTPVYRKAVSVLEIPAGTLSPDIVSGERIIFSE